MDIIFIAMTAGFFGPNSGQAFAGIIDLLVEVLALILLIKVAFLLWKKYYKPAVMYSYNYDEGTITSAKNKTIP